MPTLTATKPIRRIKEQIMADKPAVQTTTNYEKFSMLIANRSTTRPHISAIKESMQKYPQLAEVLPIVVNEKFQIIDGQHRFQAASELGLPIYYTMVKGIGIETALIMNVLQKKWEPTDYAKVYALTNNKHYAEYLKARNDFNLPHNVTVAALSGGRHKGLNAQFKRGLFEIADLQTGREYLGRIIEVAENSSIPMISPFAFALLTAFNHKNFDYARFLDMLKKHGGSILQRYTQVPDYLRMIEDIYNVGKQNRVRLF